MKRKISLILAIVLTLSSVLIMSGCGLFSKVQRGSVDEKAYTNESLGVKFTLPEGWAFYSEERLAELSGVDVEVIKDSKALKNKDFVSLHDFLAIDPKCGNNVSLVIDKASQFKNTDKLVDNLKEQIEGRTIDGCIYTASDNNSKVKLGSEEWTSFDVEIKFGEQIVNQYIFCRKIGNMFVYIMCSEGNGVGRTYFLNYFS